MADAARCRAALGAYLVHHRGERCLAHQLVSAPLSAFFFFFWNDERRRVMVIDFDRTTTYAVGLPQVGCQVVGTEHAIGLIDCIVLCLANSRSPDSSRISTLVRWRPPWRVGNSIGSAETFSFFYPFYREYLFAL